MYICIFIKFISLLYNNQIYDIFIPPFQKSVGYLIHPVFSSLFYLAEYVINFAGGKFCDFDYKPFASGLIM
jgi:hypothetical protein